MIKKNVCVVIVLMITAGGCANRSDDDELTLSTPVQFEQTTQPQTAIFYTMRSSTGGVGEPQGNRI